MEEKEFQFWIERIRFNTAKNIDIRNFSELEKYKFLKVISQNKSIENIFINEKLDEKFLTKLFQKLKSKKLKGIYIKYPQTHIGWLTNLARALEVLPVKRLEVNCAKMFINESLMRFARSLQFSILESLKVENANSSYFLQALFATLYKVPTLTNFELKNSRLTKKEMRYFPNFIGLTDSLKKLSLENCGIDDSLFRTITRYGIYNNSTLQFLNLDGNKFTDKVVENFYDDLGLSKIEFLYLSLSNNENLKENKMLSHPKVIGYRSNQGTVRDASLRMLGKKLLNNSMQELMLSGVQLDERQLNFLYSKLQHNVSLKKIGLSERTNIEESNKLLENILHLKLEYLIIDKISTREEVLALVKILNENRKLRYLETKINCSKSDEYLLMKVLKSSSLQYIKIPGKEVNSDFISKLNPDSFNLLFKNQKIKRLDLLGVNFNEYDVSVVKDLLQHKSIFRGITLSNNQVNSMFANDYILSVLEKNKMFLNIEGIDIDIDKSFYYRLLKLCENNLMNCLNLYSFLEKESLDSIVQRMNIDSEDIGVFSGFESEGFEVVKKASLIEDFQLEFFENQGISYKVTQGNTKNQVPYLMNFKQDNIIHIIFKAMLMQNAHHAYGIQSPEHLADILCSAYLQNRKILKFASVHSRVASIRYLAELMSMSPNVGGIGEFLIASKVFKNVGFKIFGHDGDILQISSKNTMKFELDIVKMKNSFYPSLLNLGWNQTGVNLVENARFCVKSLHFQYRNRCLAQKENVERKKLKV